MKLNRFRTCSETAGRHSAPAPVLRRIQSTPALPTHSGRTGLDSRAGSSGNPPSPSVTRLLTRSRITSHVCGTRAVATGAAIASVCARRLQRTRANATKWESTLDGGRLGRAVSCLNCLVARDSKSGLEIKVV